MLKIDTSSFVPNEVQSDFAAHCNWIEGQIDVTFFGRTKRLDARETSDGTYVVFDMGARYPTGTKIWQARMHVSRDGKLLYVRSGVESRSGRLARSPRIVGFFNDAPKDVRSKR